MDDFEKQLKLTFLEEAKQMLDECEQCFLSLESCPEDLTIIEQIFRLAHSFKGSAGAAGFEDLTQLAHSLENLLVSLKTCQIKVSKKIVNVLLRSNDQLRAMVNALSADPEKRIDTSAFVAEIEQAKNAAPDEDEQPATESQENFAQGSEEAKIVIKKTAAVPVSQDDSIRVNLSRIDNLVNDVGELVIMQTVLFQQRQLIPSEFLQKTIVYLEKITRNIQDTSMSLRMVSMKKTFQKMQRIVRDSAQAMEKQIDFETSGDETEIDKRILDVLADPLVHLVRNAVDHGIESADERERAGKKSAGTVHLKAYQRGEYMVLEIQDDGGGLNKERILAKAKKQGLVAPDATPSDDEIHQLVFAPGFSTKEQVTELSGRGVGMDVVKTYVEQVQGRVEIESTLGKGSCFRILLPLTLAIIDGMIVRVGQQKFVIPIAMVHESLQPQKDDVSFVSGRGSYLNVRGETIQLFRISDLMGTKDSKQETTSSIAIVGKNAQGTSFAILVDDIIGQQQIVIKKLGEELRGIAGISGAAILGDGKAALIIDMPEMVQAYSSKKVPQTLFKKEAA